MNINEIIKTLKSERQNFRKNKRANSRWPEEFQFKVLQIVESGYSFEKLSAELKIPIQTIYHWRRWYKHPKYEASKSYLLPALKENKKSRFRKVSVSAKLKDLSFDQNQEAHLQLSTVIIFSNGSRVENISEEILLRLLRAV